MPQSDGQKGRQMSEAANAPLIKLLLDEATELHSLSCCQVEGPRIAFLPDHPPNKEE